MWCPVPRRCAKRAGPVPLPGPPREGGGGSGHLHGGLEDVGAGEADLLLLDAAKPELRPLLPLLREPTEGMWGDGGARGRGQEGMWLDPLANPWIGFGMEGGQGPPPSQRRVTPSGALGNEEGESGLPFHARDGRADGATPARGSHGGVRGGDLSWSMSMARVAPKLLSSKNVRRVANENRNGHSIASACGGGLKIPPPGTLHGGVSHVENPATAGDIKKNYHHRVARIGPEDRPTGVCGRGGGADREDGAGVGVAPKRMRGKREGHHFSQNQLRGVGVAPGGGDEGWGGEVVAPGTRRRKGSRSRGGGGRGPGTGACSSASSCGKHGGGGVGDRGKPMPCGASWGKGYNKSSNLKEGNTEG